MIRTGWRPHFVENVAQPDKRHRFAPLLEVFGIADIRREFDAFHHHIERNDEVRNTDADMKTIDIANVSGRHRRIVVALQVLN